MPKYSIVWTADNYPGAIWLHSAFFYSVASPCNSPWGIIFPDSNLGLPLANPVFVEALDDRLRANVPGLVSAF